MKSVDQNLLIRSLYIQVILIDQFVIIKNTVPGLPRTETLYPVKKDYIFIILPRLSELKHSLHHLTPHNPFRLPHFSNLTGPTGLIKTHRNSPAVFDFLHFQQEIKRNCNPVVFKPLFLCLAIYIFHVL